MSSDRVALDLETTSLQPRDGHILAVGLSAGSRTTAGPVDRPADLDALAGLLRSPRALAVHHVAMEGSWSEEWFGVRLTGDRALDTQLLANRVHPGQPANLAALTARYHPEVAGYKSDTEALIRAGRILEIPREDLLARVGVDAWVTARLVEDLLPQIPESSRAWLAEDVDLTLCCDRIARRGVFYDEEEGIRLKEETERVQEEIRRKYAPLNPGSSEQVGNLLQQLGSSPTKTPRGNWATGENELRALADLAGGPVREVVADVLRYREAQKLCSTYVEGYAKRRSGDGRIRADLRWPGTVSWRCACSDPNLQNVPVGVRSLFRAHPGRRLLEADYAQAELRIGAAVAPEPVLVELFKAGRDPHGLLAQRLFGAGFNRDQRHHAKTTNFSLMYDGTENTLRTKFMEQGIVLPWRTAHTYVREFHQTYLGFGTWTDTVRRTLLDGGTIESPTAGYRWVLEDALAITNGDQEDALKAVKNWSIQCVPPRWTLRAAFQAEKEGIDVVMQTHDGLLAEVDEAEAVSAGTRLGQIMKDVASEEFMAGLPVPADVKTGSSWGAMSPLGKG